MRRWDGLSRDLQQPQLLDFFFSFVRAFQSVFTCHGCCVDDDPSPTSFQLVHVLKSQVSPPDDTHLQHETFVSRNKVFCQWIRTGGSLRTKFTAAEKKENENVSVIGRTNGI